MCAQPASTTGEQTINNTQDFLIRLGITLYRL
jgi:hypothetical protein